MPRNTPFRLKSFLICCYVCIFITASRSPAQNQQKVLQWSDHPVGSHNEISTPPNQIVRQLELIEIEKITLHGQSITLGQPFSADEDWLRDLVFHVKNVSDRDIVGIQITLRLPEMKTPPQVPYVAGCRHDKTQPCIRAGEEVEAKLSGEKLYEWVKKAVASETEMNKISKAWFYVVLVTLPGDVQWSSGCVKTADQKNACPVHVH